MRTLTLAVNINLEILLALQCRDWQGKTVPDGIDFYPKKDDPCYMCRCDKGYDTMCKNVSCAPPDCPQWKQITGKCCHFECVGGDTGHTDNSTGISKPGNDNTSSHSDSTMTDLGLRLVASTVTTFLILALLLFLIHRFRQRRLLLALRRYSRRRDRLDDSDNMDFSPEFFGIQCPPPYIDPPPPYSPPKPAPGEQPPPYDALNSDNLAINNNNVSRGSNILSLENNMLSVSSSSQNDCSVSQGNGNTMVLLTSDGRPSNSSSASRNTICGSNRNSSASGRRSDFIGHRIHEINHLGRESLLKGCSATNRNIPRVHAGLNSSSQQHITMGIQNRTRNNQNRFSDSFSPVRNLQHRNAVSNATSALNLELRSTILNFHNRNWNPQISSHPSNTIEADLSSSTTDIGESTTSAESLMSSPESPNYESETARKTEHVTSALSDDADSTVKRFLDRQFRPFTKNRRYPTTISQSWTSAQIPSAAVGPNVRQSISLGSFPGKADNQNAQMSACSLSDRTLVGPPLPRSKSDHLKTNGSLINQPYKGVIKSSNSFLNGASHATRVSYKEPGDMQFLNSPKSKTHENGCNNVEFTISEIGNNTDLNVSDFSTNMDQNRLSLQTVLLDPGEIIVTRRQDELQKLRLSHLFNKPLLNLAADGHSNRSSCFTSHRQIHRSLSENSVSSNVSMCSDTREKSTISAIGNDVQYPDKSYKQFLNSCLLNNQCSSNEVNALTLNDLVLEKKIVHRQPFECEKSSSNGNGSNSDLSKTSNESTKISHQTLPKVSMVHSWHAGQTQCCDENVPIDCGNTLLRNVNCNIEKRSCLDKDMSNVFFPFYKLSNTDVVIDRNFVPSSEKRACASQLYNYDTEEKTKRKDKKRQLFKRHSASCFMVKHENHVSCMDSKLTAPGVVSCHENHLGHKTSEYSKRYSSCERKSCKNFGDVDGLNKDSLVAELNSSSLFKCPDASCNNVKDSNECFGEVNEYLNTRRSHTLGKNEKKRCKSAGKGDFVMSAGKKVSSNNSSQAYPSRKKKSQMGSAVSGNNHNSELGPQDSPILTSVHKTQCMSKGVNPMCAMTKV